MLQSAKERLVAGAQLPIRTAELEAQSAGQYADMRTESAISGTVMCII